MDDLISREALLESFKKAYCYRNQCSPIGVWDLCEECPAYNAYRLIVSAEPAAEAEPVRHGRWIAKEDEVSYWWECSECHSDETQKSPYCPNCGARMDLEVDE